MKYSENKEFKLLAETILTEIETILPFKWQQLELLTKGKIKDSTCPKILSANFVTCILKKK